MTFPSSNDEFSDPNDNVLAYKSEILKAYSKHLHQHDTERFYDPSYICSSPTDSPSQSAPQSSTVVSSSSSSLLLPHLTFEDSLYWEQSQKNPKATLSGDSGDSVTIYTANLSPNDAPFPISFEPSLLLEPHHKIKGPEFVQLTRPVVWSAKSTQSIRTSHTHFPRLSLSSSFQQLSSFAGLGVGNIRHTINRLDHFAHPESNDRIARAELSSLLKVKASARDYIARGRQQAIDVLVQKRYPDFVASTDAVAGMNAQIVAAKSESANIDIQSYRYALLCTSDLKDKVQEVGKHRKQDEVVVRLHAVNTVLSALDTIFHEAEKEADLFYIGLIEVVNEKNPFFKPAATTISSYIPSVPTAVHELVNQGKLQMALEMLLEIRKRTMSLLKEAPIKKALSALCVAMSAPLEQDLIGNSVIYSLSIDKFPPFLQAKNVLDEVKTIRNKGRSTDKKSFKKEQFSSGMFASSSASAALLTYEHVVLSQDLRRILSRCEKSLEKFLTIYRDLTTLPTLCLSLTTTLCEIARDTIHKSTAASSFLGWSQLPNRIDDKSLSFSDPYLWIMAFATQSPISKSFQSALDLASKTVRTLTDAFFTLQQCMVEESKYSIQESGPKFVESENDILLSIQRKISANFIEQRLRWCLAPLHAAQSILREIRAGDDKVQTHKNSTVGAHLLQRALNASVSSLCSTLLVVHIFSDVKDQERDKVTSFRFSSTSVISSLISGMTQIQALLCETLAVDLDISRTFGHTDVRILRALSRNFLLVARLISKPLYKASLNLLREIVEKESTLNDSSTPELVSCGELFDSIISALRLYRVGNNSFSLNLYAVYFQPISMSMNQVVRRVFQQTSRLFISTTLDILDAFKKGFSGGQNTDNDDVKVSFYAQTYIAGIMHALLHTKTSPFSFSRSNSTFSSFPSPSLTSPFNLATVLAEVRLVSGHKHENEAEVTTSLSNLLHAIPISLSSIRDEFSSSHLDSNDFTQTFRTSRSFFSTVTRSPLLCAVLEHVASASILSTLSQTSTSLTGTSTTSLASRAKWLAGKARSGIFFEARNYLELAKFIFPYSFSRSSSEISGDITSISNPTVEHAIASCITTFHMILLAVLQTSLSPLRELSRVVNEFNLPTSYMLHLQNFLSSQLNELIQEYTQALTSRVISQAVLDGDFMNQNKGKNNTSIEPLSFEPSRSANSLLSTHFLTTRLLSTFLKPANTTAESSAFFGVFNLLDTFHSWVTNGVDVDSPFENSQTKLTDLLVLDLFASSYESLRKQALLAFVREIMLLFRQNLHEVEVGLENIIIMVENDVIELANRFIIPLLEIERPFDLHSRLSSSLSTLSPSCVSEAELCVEVIRTSLARSMSCHVHPPGISITTKTILTFESFCDVTIRTLTKLLISHSDTLNSSTKGSNLSFFGVSGGEKLYPAFLSATVNAMEKKHIKFAKLMDLAEQRTILRLQAPFSGVSSHSIGVDKSEKKSINRSKIEVDEATSKLSFPSRETIQRYFWEDLQNILGDEELISNPYFSDDESSYFASTTPTKLSLSRSQPDNSSMTNLGSTLLSTTSPSYIPVSKPSFSPPATNSLTVSAISSPTSILIDDFLRSPPAVSTTNSSYTSNASTVNYLPHENRAQDLSPQLFRPSAVNAPGLLTSDAFSSPFKGLPPSSVAAHPLNVNNISSSINVSSPLTGSTSMTSSNVSTPSRPRTQTVAVPVYSSPQQTPQHGGTIRRTQPQVAHAVGVKQYTYPEKDKK